MVQLSDLILQIEALDQRKSAALNDFKSTWEEGEHFMGSTPQEKKIRSGILENRNQALHVVIDALTNDFMSLFDGSISNCLIKEKNKLNNNSLNGLKNLAGESIAQTKKTLDHQMHTICAAYTKEIFDNLDYFQQAIKLRDAQCDFYRSEGNTEFEAKALSDFEGRVRPFVTCFREYGYLDMADDLNEIKKIIKNKAYFLNMFTSLESSKARMASPKITSSPLQMAELEQKDFMKAGLIESQSHYQCTLPTIAEDEESLCSEDTKIQVNTSTVFFKPIASPINDSKPIVPTTKLNASANAFVPKIPFSPNVAQSSPALFNKVVGSQRIQKNIENGNIDDSKESKSYSLW